MPRSGASCAGGALHGAFALLHALRDSAKRFIEQEVIEGATGREDLIWEW